VIIIGGGDTGADCLGTVHRQGAASVHQLEIMPEPPDHRGEDNPWPTWPLVFRTSSAHEEGCERVFSVNTECFLGDADGGARETAEALASALGASVAPVVNQDAGLLVIDSRPEAQDGRVTVSSSAAHLVEIATCPVLVLPRGARLQFGRSFSPAAA